jgi:hypothetical protein
VVATPKDGIRLNPNAVFGEKSDHREYVSKYSWCIATGIEAQHGKVRVKEYSDKE